MRYTESGIGENAGKIWGILNENGEMTASGIEKATGLKKEDVLLALGWLYREGQIVSSKVGRGVNFSLK